MTSTRQLRINNPELIRKRMHEFLGKKINIVLLDNRVIVGELQEVNATGVILKNMRLRLMKFGFSEITEIYFDRID